MDIIDQIDGWRSVGGVAARYGEGYSFEQQRLWFMDCSVLTYWIKLLVRVILKGRCYLSFYKRLGWVMLDKEKDTKQEDRLIKPLLVSRLSHFFYQNSGILIAVFFTIVFIGYLFFIMMGKAAGFEMADGNIKSLGTSFGFDHADIIIFLAARTDEMINAYINFNKVWDTLFGLIYGLMYVVWMSVLFKPSAQKVGFLNLFPFAQVLFDWLENYALASLANQYLVDGLISLPIAKLASVFCMLKWVCSGFTSILILVGIILIIAQAIKNKKQI
jgi:hypothetical protein